MGARIVPEVQVFHNGVTRDAEEKSILLVQRENEHQYTQHVQGVRSGPFQKRQDSRGTDRHRKAIVLGTSLLIIKGGGARAPYTHAH